MSRWAAALAVLSVAFTASAQESDLKFSGYYKNLLVNSETLFPDRERYTLDLNRLRLEVKGKLSDHAAVDVQYDNELLLGNYLNTQQFASQKDVVSDQYWNLGRNYVEGNTYYGRHRLYRVSTTLSSGETDLRIGRQRIAWGTGRFWSPLDILNPLDPIALEREERPGVDALLVERKLGPVSRLAAVHAPQHDRADASTAVQWHGNAKKIDFSFVAGRFHSDRVLGMDLATQIGDAGLRGELTYTRREHAPSYTRVVVGADYAFANTLTVTGEAYYNGAGTSDKRNYDFQSLLAGRVQTLARRYVGLYAGYELTPLWKCTTYFVTNLNDHSRFFSPSLTHSVKANLDWTLGGQFFAGSDGSEYGRLRQVYYMQLQWFF